MSRHAQIFEHIKIMCAKTGHGHVTGCVPDLGMQCFSSGCRHTVFFTSNEVYLSNGAVNVMLQHLRNEKLPSHTVSNYGCSIYGCMSKLIYNHMTFK